MGISVIPALACAYEASAAEITAGDEQLPAFQALEDGACVGFEPLREIDANDFEGSLIDGVPNNPAEFPAIVRLATGGTCTAARVGPAAMLLAAHCVGDGERIAFVAGDRSIAGICEHAPGYHPITGGRSLRAANGTSPRGIRPDADPPATAAEHRQSNADRVGGDGRGQSGIEHKGRV